MTIISDLVEFRMEMTIELWAWPEVKLADREVGRD